MKTASTPREAIQILDDAFNEGDLDSIMDLYDEGALVIPRPGIEARGKDAIRKMYTSMLQPGTVARQLKVCVLETDGIALFLSQWSLSGKGEEVRTFISTTVLRKQDDGAWKAIIDNAQGPAILNLSKNEA